MEVQNQPNAVLKGGEFLVRESLPSEIFIPEDANEEQRMMQQMAADFVAAEIGPNMAKIERQENNISAAILERAGAQGLLGVHMPEEYGGLNLHTNTNTMITEEMGKAGSWTTTYAAHIGIGMLPILYYGTPEQKAKYLPGMISGELKASYCLTEPGSGSDALAAKSRADLSEDGQHYILNGQKMWITNAGFSDVFIVFAKVGGEKFTGFIVEKGMPGFTLGAEEHKLGIHGSSTRQVFFENVKVPVGNVLGEIGKGHLIAFNVLNIGRFKLGVLTLGGSKEVLAMGAKYANERHQFGVPIGSFGAIQHKLSEMTMRCFALESSIYRVSDLLQDKINELKASGMPAEQAKLAAAEEYAIECAILKVHGSETLDYCVDENVQIHGGMGFSEECMASKAYRDARITRIYEGTNEINRLLSVDMLLRRAMTGHINITDAAWAVQKELASIPSMTAPEGPYGREKEALKNLKKCILMVAGAAVKTQMDGQINLKHEQEIIMNVADMMVGVFTLESTLLRVQKVAERKSAAEMEPYHAILHVYLQEVNAQIRHSAETALASFAVGDVLDVLLRGVTRFTKLKPVNTKELRRSLAKRALEMNQYPI
jgi:alkylation response protein AidB-like acyl-CoA dehydrogenase